MQFRKRRKVASHRIIGLTVALIIAIAVAGTWMVVVLQTNRGLQGILKQATVIYVFRGGLDNGHKTIKLATIKYPDAHLVRIKASLPIPRARSHPAGGFTFVIVSKPDARIVEAEYSTDSGELTYGDESCHLPHEIATWIEQLNREASDPTLSTGQHGNLAITTPRPARPRKSPQHSLPSAPTMTFRTHR